MTNKIKLIDRLKSWLVTLGIASVFGLAALGVNAANSYQKASAYEIQNNGDIVFDDFTLNDFTVLFNFVDEYGTVDNSLKVFYCNPYLYDDDDTSYELEQIYIGYEPNSITFVYDEDNDGYISYTFNDNLWSLEEVMGGFVTPPAKLVFNSSTTGYYVLYDYINRYEIQQSLYLNYYLGTGEEVDNENVFVMSYQHKMFVDYIVSQNYSVNTWYELTGLCFTDINNITFIPYYVYFYDSDNFGIFEERDEQSHSVFTYEYTEGAWSVSLTDYVTDVHLYVSPQSNIYYSLANYSYSYNAPQSSGNFISALTDFMSLIGGGIVQLAQSVGAGVVSFASGLFLDSGHLSILGGIIGIFAGIALAVGITSKVYTWVSTLGN